MRKWNWMKLGVVIASLAMLYVAGCSGHHDNGLPDPGAGTAPDLSQITGQNEARLDPAPSGSPSALGITGMITLQGFTVLDSQLKPAPANQINTRITAQLIDEEDDILSTIAPGTDGKYTLSVFSPSLALRLRIMATVAEDLNGDGTGNDVLTQEVPVVLVTGKTIKVDLRVKRAVQADMQPVLWPAKGAVALCDLNRTDGSGSFTSYYGTFFNGGFVIITRDGDRLLEEGDDLRQPDTDRNGWADPSQAIYGNATLPAATLTGIVMSVDLVAQTMVVRGPGNISTVVFVSPFCAIEAYTQATGFFGSIPLSSNLIGKAVTITGQTGPGGMIAEWIVYTP
jgi:hypothetical protein